MQLSCYGREQRVQRECADWGPLYNLDVGQIDHATCLVFVQGVFLKLQRFALCFLLRDSRSCIFVRRTNCAGVETDVGYRTGHQVNSIKYYNFMIVFFSTYKVNVQAA